MAAYPDITTYQMLLAHNDLGSVNMQFYDGYGQLVSNSVALDTLRFEDQDTFEQYKTYGAVANYYERNRRINGAYGPTYDGQVNWLNPVNHFNLIQENKFYYLQDFVGNGRYSGLFIQGLTFCTRDRPAVYYQYYNSTFFTDPGSYYRVDIMGSAYPRSHGGVKADIIIQQFSNYRVSDKLYLSFDQATGHPYHGEYQIRVPITLLLFNDKLYTPTAIVPPSTDPLDPTTDPVVNPIDPIPPQDPTPPTYDPIISPYASWGGDTTDTGMTESSVTAYNPYMYTNQEEVDYYFPIIPGWRRWFVWQ